MKNSLLEKKYQQHRSRHAFSIQRWNWKTQTSDAWAKPFKHEGKHANSLPRGLKETNANNSRSLRHKVAYPETNQWIQFHSNQITKSSLPTIHSNALPRTLDYFSCGETVRSLICRFVFQLLNETRNLPLLISCRYKQPTPNLYSILMYCFLELRQLRKEEQA